MEETPSTPDPTPGLEASCGWLELPGNGGVNTASEHKFKLDKDNRNYTAYYDSQTKSSLWVAYPLAAGHFESGTRTDEWDYAPGIDESLQIDVAGSHTYAKANEKSYDRGHQIPNADRNAVEAMRLQTYYFINCTPQVDGLNGGAWLSLENAMRNDFLPTTDTLYIATGPVYKTVGGSETVYTTTTSSASAPQTVQIPNYYFKVVMKVKRNDVKEVTSALALGFWYENKSYAGLNKKSSDFALSVDEIERKTGFDFFANLPDEMEAAAETNADWTTFLNY